MPELELPSLEALAGMPKEQRDALIDSLPDEQLNALYRQHEPQIKAVQQERFAKLPPLTETFPKDVERGLYTTGAGYLGAADTARALVGADSDYFAKEQDRLLKKAAEIPGSVGSWTGVDFTDLGQVGRYGAEAVGENLVQLGTSILPAGLVGQFAKALGFVKAAPKIAAGVAAASNVAQETGGIAGDIRGYTGKPLDFGDAAAALAAGTGAGLLEAIGDVKLLKALIPDEAARKAFGANLGKSFLARTADFAAKTGLNGLEQGVLEFATEVPQSVVESIPVAWMKAGKTDDFLKSFFDELTTDEKKIEYLDSGLKGFSSGGPTGAGAYAVGRGAAAIGDELNRKRAERVLAELKQFSKDNPAPDTASVTPRTEEPAAAEQVPYEKGPSRLRRPLSSMPDLTGLVVPPAAQAPADQAPPDLAQLAWSPDAGLMEAQTADESWDVRTGLPRRAPEDTGLIQRTEAALAAAQGAPVEPVVLGSRLSRQSDVAARKQAEYEREQTSHAVSRLGKISRVNKPAASDFLPPPLPDRMDSAEEVLTYREKYRQAEIAYYRSLGLTEAEARRLFDSGDARSKTEVSDLQKKLGPETWAKVEQVGKQTPYHWDRMFSPEKMSGLETIPEVAKALVGNVDKAGSYVMGDRLLHAAIGLTKLRDLGATWQDVAREVGLWAREQSSSPGDSDFLVSRMAEKLLQLADSQGIQLPLTKTPTITNENQIPPASPVPVVESKPAEAPPAKPPEGRAAPEGSPDKEIKAAKAAPEVIQVSRKRSPDFATTGEYIYTDADGKEVARLFKDPDSGWWYAPDDINTERTAARGFTQKEAEQKLGLVVTKAPENKSRLKQTEPKSEEAPQPSAKEKAKSFLKKGIKRTHEGEIGSLNLPNVKQQVINSALNAGIDLIDAGAKVVEVIQAIVAKLRELGAKFEEREVWRQLGPGLAEEMGEPVPEFKEQAVTKAPASKLAKQVVVPNSGLVSAKSIEDEGSADEWIDSHLNVKPSESQKIELEEQQESGLSKPGGKAMFGVHWRKVKAVPATGERLMQWWREEIKGGRKAAVEDPSSLIYSPEQLLEQAQGKVAGGRTPLIGLVQGSSALALVFRLADGTYAITSVKEQAAYKKGTTPYVLDPNKADRVPKGETRTRIGGPSPFVQLEKIESSPTFKDAQLIGYTRVSDPYQLRASFSSVLGPREFQLVEGIASEITRNEMAQAAERAAVPTKVQFDADGNPIETAVSSPEDQPDFVPAEASVWWDELLTQRKKLGRPLTDRELYGTLKQFSLNDPQSYRKLLLSVLPGMAASMDQDEFNSLIQRLSVNKQEQLHERDKLADYIVSGTQEALEEAIRSGSGVLGLVASGTKRLVAGTDEANLLRGGPETENGPEDGLRYSALPNNEAVYQSHEFWKEARNFNKLRDKLRFLGEVPDRRNASDSELKVWRKEANQFAQEELGLDDPSLIDDYDLGSSIRTATEQIEERSLRAIADAFGIGQSDLNRLWSELEIAALSPEPKFSALPASSTETQAPIPQLIHENNLRQSAALRQSSGQPGTAPLVSSAAARQDAEAALAGIRLARNGPKLDSATIDSAYSQTEIGQTLLARARKEGIKLAFIRGLPDLNGVQFRDSILISTDGRSDSNIEGAFEHELAHHKYQQGDSKLRELGRLAKLDSAAAKALQAFYLKSGLQKLEGAALREELVATFVGGTANYEGIPLVGAFGEGARELVQEYLGGKRIEEIKAAAVRSTSGAVYEGNWHMQARERMEAAGDREAASGYVTTYGRFVDGNEALEIADKARQLYHKAQQEKDAGKIRRLDTAHVKKADESGTLATTESPSFSASQDAEYLAAVQAGDMGKAGRMVEEAARRAGYANEVLLSRDDLNRWDQKRLELETRLRIAQNNVNAASAALEKSEGSEAVKRIAAKSLARNQGIADDIQHQLEVGPPPKKLTHGSSRTWTEYERKQGGRAIWATDSADVSASYGSNSTSLFMKMGNPLIVDAEGASFKNLSFEGNRLDADDLAQIAEERGYDGLVIRNFYDSNDDSGGDHIADHFAVFSPEQIKSADPVTYDSAGNVIPLSQRFDAGTGDIRYSLPDTAEQARFRQSVKEAELSRGAAVPAAEAAAKQSFENWLSTFKAPAEAIAQAASRSSDLLAEIRAQASLEAPEGQRLSEEQREQKRIAKRTLSQSFLRILSRLEREVQAATDAAGPDLLSFEQAKADAALPPEQQRLSATERNRIYTRAYEHVSKIWAAIAAFRNTFDNRRHAITDQLIELQKERKDLKTEQGLRKAIQEQVVELFDEGLALGEAGAKRRAIYKQARLGSSTGSHVLAFLGSQLDDIRAAAERNLADRQAAADAQMARTGQPRQTLELSESDWMAGVMEVAAYLGRQINPDDPSSPEQVLGANEQRVQEVVRAWLGDQALQTMVQEVRDALTQAQLQPIGGLLPKAAAAKFEELRQAYVRALQESDGDLAKLREAKRKLLRIANVTSTQNLDLLLKVVARKGSRLEAEMAALPTANLIISELTHNSSPFARLSREIADAEAVGVVHQLMGTDRETGELVLNALPGLGTSGNFLIQILTELKQAGNLPDKLTAKQWKDLFLSNPSIPPYIIESLDWPSDSTVLDSAQTDNKDNLIRVVMTAEKAALPVRVSLRPENSQAAEQQIRRYLTVARQYVIGAGLEGPQAGQPGPASRAYDPRIARALSLEVIPKLETIIGQAESKGRLNEQGKLEGSLTPSSMSPKSGTTRFGVANRFALGLQALLSRFTKRGGWFAIASIDSKGLPPYLRNFLFSAATAHAGLQSQIESLVADRGPRLDAALNDALNEQEIRNRDLEVYEREVFNPIAASYQHADTGRRLVAGDRIGNGRTVTKEDIRLLELTHELWNRAGDIMVRNGLGIQVTTPEGHPAHRPMWDLGPKMVPRSAFRMQNLADEFKNLRDPVNQTFDLVQQMELLARNPDLIDAYAAGAGHNEYKHNYAGLRQAIFRVWSRVLAGGNAEENQPLGSNGLHPLVDLANRVAAEFNQDQLQVLGEAEGPVRQLAPEAVLRTLQADIRDIFLKVAGEEGRLPGDLKTLLDAEGNLKLDATRSMSFNTLALIVGGTTELVSPRGNLIAPPGWYDYSAFSHEAVKRMNRIAEWPFLLRALETMATLQKAVETELKTLEESLTQQPLRGPDRGKPPTLLGPQRSKDAAAGLQWMTYGQLKALSVSLQTMVQDLQQRLISAKERPAGVPKFATVGEVGGRTAKRWYQASITSVLATMSVYALQAVGGWAKLTAQIARTSPNRLTGAITAAPKAAGFILKGLKRSVIYNELVNQIASTPGLRDALGITSVTAFDRKQLTTVIMPAMLKFMEEQVHLMDEMVAAGIITRESTWEAAAGILEFWGSGGEPGLRPLLESPGRIKSAALTGGMSAVAVANLVNALFRRGLAVADNANNIAGAMWAQTILDTLHRKLLLAYNAGMPAEQVGLQSLLSSEYPAESIKHLQDFLGESQLNLVGVYRRLQQKLDAASPEEQAKIRQALPFSDEEIHRAWLAGASITNKSTLWNRPSASGRREFLTSALGLFKNYALSEFLDIVGSATSKMSNQGWLRAMPMMLAGLAGISLTYAIGGLGLNDFDKWWKRFAMRITSTRSTVSDILAGRVLDPKEQQAILVDGVARVGGHFGWLWYLATGRSKGERQGFELNRIIYGLNLLQDLTMNGLQAAKQFSLSAITDPNKTLLEKAEAAWLPVKDPIYNTLGRYVAPFTWFKNWLPGTEGKAALQGYRATLISGHQRMGANIKETSNFVGKNYDAATPYYSGAAAEAAAGNIEKALALRAEGRKQLSKLYGQREENGRIVGLSEQELDQRDAQRIQSMLPVVGEKKPDASTRALIESTLTPRELAEVQQVEANFAAFSQAATGKTVSPISTRGAASGGSGGGGGGSIAGISGGSGSSGGSGGAAAGSSLSGRSRLSGGSSLGRSRLSGGRLSGSRLSSGRRISSGRISSGRSAMKPKVMGRLKVRSSRLGGRRLRL